MRITSRLFNVASSSLFPRYLFFFFSLSLSHSVSFATGYRIAHALILQLPLAVNATTANTKHTQIAHTARWPKSVCKRERKKKQEHTCVAVRGKQRKCEKQV